MYRTGEAPEQIISHLGLRQISNEEELEKIIENVIESNPEKVKAYQSGKSGLIGFFMGQVMKESGGQANPNLVNQILKGKLD
jgi:aspartyl-tRNA(Asn)/glutamyl-tRNA(Gln) amidotransferase subunit B